MAAPDILSQLPPGTDWPFPHLPVNNIFPALGTGQPLDTFANGLVLRAPNNVGYPTNPTPTGLPPGAPPPTPPSQFPQTGKQSQATEPLTPTPGAAPGQPPAPPQPPVDPALQQWMSERAAAYDESKKKLDALEAKMNAAPEGSDERHAAMRELMDQSRQLGDDYAALSQKQPVPQTPFQAASAWTPLMLLMIGLAGSFSRSPGTAAAGALAGALNGMVEGNDKLYQRSVDAWKTQANLLNTHFNAVTTEIGNIWKDEDLTWKERQEQLQNAYQIYGLQKEMSLAKSNDWASAFKMQTDREKTAGEAGLRTAQTEKALSDALKSQAQTKLMNTLGTTGKGSPEQMFLQGKIREYQSATGEQPTPEMLQKWDQDFTAGKRGLEVSKMYDVLDDKGHVIRTVMARERRDQSGFIDSQTGNPLELKPGEHLRQITATTTGGGRAGAQVLRQQIGGREVISDLQNAVRLPVGTTTGLLGGVVPGTSVVGALHGDLTRTLTSQESQLMQASMASLTRELSILMSPVYGGNYAAQQIEPLIPQAGNTIGTVLFKLARIAQSADNALEAIEKSPILSNEQQEYAVSLREQINKAIFWSPTQAMDFALKDRGGESFGDFVKRSDVAGSTAIPTDLPSPAGHPDGFVARDSSGKVVAKIQNGKWVSP